MSVAEQWRRVTMLWVANAALYTLLWWPCAVSAAFVAVYCHRRYLALGAAR